MNSTSNIIVIPSVYRSRRTFEEEYALDGLLERKDELNSVIASLEVALDSASNFFPQILQPIEALIREAKADRDAVSAMIEKT